MRVFFVWLSFGHVQDTLRVCVHGVFAHIGRGFHGKIASNYVLMAPHITPPFIQVKKDMSVDGVYFEYVNQRGHDLSALKTPQDRT